jgi:peptidoglycan/xylan/chitin deacetylase (PgdA/CDA1 family)
MINIHNKKIVKYRHKKGNKRQKWNVVYLFLIAIIIVGSIALITRAYNTKKNSVNKKTAINNSQTLSVQNKVVQNNTPIATTNSTEAPSKSKLTNLKIPILMYHHIRSYNDPSDKIGTNLSVTPADLSEQLNLIQQRGYTTITFDDLANGNIPEKPIILTFDDGYSNFYQNAFPLIKSHKMKAVSFIITGYIGGSDYMTTEQIKEISDYGIEIGSHTISHPDLSTLSEKSSRSQIFDSKKTLENMLSKPVISFCYPSGKYTAETESLVKEAGYTFATTTKGGITTFGDDFALNRYRVNNDTNISSYIK